VVRKILVLLLVAFAACSSTPASPSSTALTGTWRIVSIQPELQGVQAAPAGAVYELTFDAAARVSARVDCNTCGGSFMLSGSSLVIGSGLACTRAACSTAAFESAALGILGGSHEITATSSTLMLNSIRGTMTLTRR
jgi:heat shock protein HslJ